MDIAKRYEQLHQRAKELAIQSSNLRNQIEPLELLEKQLSETLKEAQQIAGAMTILQESIQEAAQKPAESRLSPLAEELMNLSMTSFFSGAYDHMKADEAKLDMKAKFCETHTVEEYEAAFAEFTAWLKGK